MKQQPCIYCGGITEHTYGCSGRLHPVERMIKEGMESGKYVSMAGKDSEGNPVNLITTKPTPSVEKSEGEEARMVPQRINALLNPGWWVASVHIALWEIHGRVEEDSDKWEAIAEKVIDDRFMGHIKEIYEYAHSSGDRGRKEWPSEEEIEKEAEEKYASYLRKESFREGAKWVIEYMNQGQKSKS